MLGSTAVSLNLNDNFVLRIWNEMTLQIVQLWANTSIMISMIMIQPQPLLHTTCFLEVINSYFVAIWTMHLILLYTIVRGILGAVHL